MSCDDKVQILSLMEIKGISQLDVLEVLYNYKKKKIFQLLNKILLSSSYKLSCLDNL